MTGKIAASDSDDRWREDPSSRFKQVTQPQPAPQPSPPASSAPPPLQLAPPNARVIGTSDQTQRSDPAPAVVPPQSQATLPETLADHTIEGNERRWQDIVSSARTSSWLLSLAIHLGLLILLALLTFRLGGNDTGIAIEGSRSTSTSDARLESVSVTPDLATDNDQQLDTQVEVNVMQPEKDLATIQTDSVLPKNPLELSEHGLLEGGGGPQVSQMMMYMGGGGMSARTPEGRIKYGEQFGATSESEAAVEQALRWLQTHQQSDGSWSFNLDLAPCGGRCRHGKPASESTPTPKTAATGLALLAFLGAGYTADVGPYQDTVRKGIYYLKSVALETQVGFDWQQGGSMYGHGIATLAMSEAMAMMKINGQVDSDLFHHVQQAANFTTHAQHPNGSWGYTPGRPGDITITGWQVLSLVTAKKAGVQTRSDTFPRAKRFVMSVRDEPRYQFGYNSPKPEKTTTAIGLTLLLYLGQQPGLSFFDRELDRIAERGPTLTNVYHDYYATMALHHIRHRDWEAWNTQLRDHLVRTQSKTGHEAGSWHFSDKWGNVGGRLYTTAMCALILEVYYRYLPLYEAPEEFPL
ncbi:prenyltransferase/squalene oxidase repeat-containing protein [Roseiconus lacunae]|uniref:prenyltransferase/squalene oxidase repeat-containing protein n=1 Tax=Roseiconus lacunae TaxID=2605694 RepID=UPI00308570FF|nr:prenyltransferase/squalene oxidase repeat-containing protein [Stieleria sp. HD01]